MSTTLASLLLVIFLFSSQVFSQETKSKPCQSIKSACIAAGYTKGDHKKDKKGLFVDCMKPIMAGTAVEGVTVDPAEVDACKAMKTKHKAKKMK